MERRVEEMVNGELLMVNEKMKKWKEVKFEDLYLEPSRNGLSRPTHVRGSGIKMVNMKEIFSYDLISNVNMELVPVNDKEIELMTLKEGDLLFARQSLVLEGAGKISYVKKLSEPTTFESHIIRVRLNHAIVDSLFYYYYFKTPYANMKSIVQQCAQSGIRGSDLKNLRIPLPPLPTQQRIAAILSAYDDLIENNRRRITLLEDSARLLYKEWFVKFKFPGHEKVKVKNGLPEGWGRKKIGDIIEVGRGSSPRPIADTRYFEDGTIPWIKIADATASKIFIHRTKEYVNEFGASFSRKLKPGSMILAASGTLGFPMFLGVEACIHDGWLYFEKIEEYFKEYFYFNLLDLRNYFQNQSLGSAIQNINTNVVRETPLILPQKQIINLFSEKTNPIFKQIHLLQVQTQKLREARNILLPKLMNGTIEV
jgi:type I restriction enzyme S subunit